MNPRLSISPSPTKKSKFKTNSGLKNKAYVAPKMIQETESRESQCEVMSSGDESVDKDEYETDLIGRVNNPVK